MCEIDIQPTLTIMRLILLSRWTVFATLSLMFAPDIASALVTTVAACGLVLFVLNRRRSYQRRILTVAEIACATTLFIVAVLNAILSAIRLTNYEMEIAFTVWVPLLVSALALYGLRWLMCPRTEDTLEMTSRHFIEGLQQRLTRSVVEA